MIRNQRADSPGLVELQLLRHGPPHNQLLSPLTDYLSLCGDHPNTTLRIPLEHAALETRLRALRYFDSEETRLDQLRETSRIASELLAKVPGLIAELSTNRGSDAPFVHLSIVSRAAELALFPFELAISADGLPGAGQYLSLQKQLPICLTRRSRNIRNDDFVWDRPIKILMVASDMGGPIPVVQHYALLRTIVEPWVGRMTLPDNLPTSLSKLFQTNEQRVATRRNNVLRLITDADVNTIAEVLEYEVAQTGEPFTHIHVLAHGADLPDTDRRSGVAFHHPTQPGKTDIVDGRRLALTLGCLPDYPEEANRYQGPAVVTLATCSSADQGSVKISGASVAFDLHDSGIPLVVGSQFPLTADGSLIMTEAMYYGFLAGSDPRSTIWEARRALMAHVPNVPKNGPSLNPSSHDWASMTVYAALPANIDLVLPSHWSKRNQKRMTVCLENIQSLIPAIVTDSNSPNVANTSLAEEPFLIAMKNAEDEAKIFSRWTDTLENIDESTRARNFGILASAQKQIGLIWVNASLVMRAGSVSTEPNRAAAGSTSSSVPNPDPSANTATRRSQWLKEGESWLRKSRDEYHRIFESARNKTWALVQFIALDFALRADFDISKWTLAQQLALLDERSSRKVSVETDINRRGDMATILKRYRIQVATARVEALAALLELVFLQWLRESIHLPMQTVYDTLDPYFLADSIRRLHREEPETLSAVNSAIRQFRRYTDFAERANYVLRFVSKQQPEDAQTSKSQTMHDYWNIQTRKIQDDRDHDASVKKRKKLLLDSQFNSAIERIEDVLKVFDAFEEE